MREREGGDWRVAGRDGAGGPSARADSLAEALAQGGDFGGFGGLWRALAEQAVEELGVAGAGLEAGEHLA